MLLELVPAQHQAYIYDLFATATEDVNNGVVASTEQERIKFFNAWKGWLSAYFPTVRPDMLGISEAQKIDLLVTFGSYVRSGKLSRRKRKVRSATAAVSLRAIGTTLSLDGKPNPLEGPQGKLPKKISMLLEGYKRQDPPPEPKLAVPVAVPNEMYRIGYTGKTTERQKCIGDFGIIAFYYLLRVGEYTFHKVEERQRTQQFRLCDVTLWHHTNRLDPELPLQTLYRLCTAVTLNISN